MKFDWHPHPFLEPWGYSLAKHNGYSIIRANPNLNSHQSRHLSAIGGAMYEVLHDGDIHRFKSRKEMEEFVSK